MSLLSRLREVAIAGGLVGAISTLAVAQACEETAFSSKNAEIYLKAENEVMANDNPQAALVHLNTLRQQELNCYEFGAALQLGAAIKLESEDYQGAINDLLRLIQDGYIKDDAVAQAHFNISQIYLTLDNLDKSLEFMNKWLAGGGQPDRGQKWILAVIYQKKENYRESLKWAEAVFKEDGPDAKREVYDFLIFLYDQTGNLAKKAELLEYLLIKNPNERMLWDAISGDYFRANQDRRAFAVQQALYAGGILETEDELIRVVNFYNQFNAPYQAARVLEKEMNAGRISKDYKRLELLANLYQVAREFERAIPVIEEAAQIAPNGQMYERLGRSYVELQDWDLAEENLIKAINKGGLKDTSLAWVLIGQARFESDDRSGAREAFRKSNSRGGRGWLGFMDAEEATATALARFEISSLVEDLKVEKRRCDKLAVLGGEPTEECQTVEDRLEAAAADLVAFDNA